MTEITELDADTVGAEATAREWRGANVDAAVDAALAELGIGRDEADVEIVSAGVRAVPGERLSAGGEAVVRVRRVDPRIGRARSLLAELLDRMDIPATVTIRRTARRGAGHERPTPGILDVSGDDLGLLIGWRGETLRSLQTVVNLMMGDDGEDESDASSRIVVDVERYRARREDQVRELAQRLAHRVKRSGERYTMDPMQAYERRAVHMALEADAGVRTESSGRDPVRRVIIHPTGPPQTDLPERAPGERERPFDRGGRRRGRR